MLKFAFLDELDHLTLFKKNVKSLVFFHIDSFLEIDINEVINIKPKDSGKKVTILESSTNHSEADNINMKKNVT